MTHRGSVSLLHNTVQEMLVYILEEHSRGKKKPRIAKEHPVPSKIEFGRTWVIDVADLTNKVYYEVESDQSLTESTREKQKALAKHTQRDLVIIPVWEIKEDWSMSDIERWLRERVI